MKMNNNSTYEGTNERTENVHLNSWTTWFVERQTNVLVRVENLPFFDDCPKTRADSSTNTSIAKRYRAKRTASWHLRAKRSYCVCCSSSWWMLVLLLRHLLVWSTWMRMVARRRNLDRPVGTFLLLLIINVGM